MNIEKNVNGTQLQIALEGRLDTNSSPQLEGTLKQNIGGMDSLIFDLKDLVYISSAGLRVLLNAQKVMNKQGNMIIKNSNEEIMDIFDVTGFVDILNIE
ncbi:MAG: STAS domain-containing protein [Lachnospiraceae bacterium]|nr:STAS domain-containing protein [Lachnospiraceae bacterium]